MAKLNSMDISYSRYNKGGTTENYSNRIGWWDRKIFSPARDDITLLITTKYNKRPDLVAYDVYGNPQYMWVVLQYNNILDINTEFIIGKTIKLPSINRLKTEIL